MGYARWAVVLEGQGWRPRRGGMVWIVGDGHRRQLFTMRDRMGSTRPLENEGAKYIDKPILRGINA